MWCLLTFMLTGKFQFLCIYSFLFVCLTVSEDFFAQLGLRLILFVFNGLFFFLAGNDDGGRQNSM